MYTDGRDEYMLPEHFQQSSHISIPVSAQTWHNRRTSTVGPSSSTAEDDSDTQSNTSSSSTAPSSAPSRTPPPPPAINPMNNGSELRCEFEFIDCHVSFHLTQVEEYISHTASHFLGHRPPPKTICIFCDQIFEDPNDRVANWTRRMRHIADHYRRFERFEHTRPDFLVIKYLQKKRIITPEDYKSATGHSERPPCDGLVDRSYRTLEMKRKERLIEVPHDLEKEARHRRRHASKAKGKSKGK